MRKSFKPLLLAAVSGAATVSFAAGVKAQDVRTNGTRPNRALLSSGAFVLGVPYVASVVVAATSDRSGDEQLYVPVAGPWMDLSGRRCATVPSCDHEALYKGLLIGDGILQTLGAVEIVGAFLFPETPAPTPRQVARRPAPTALWEPRLGITPTFSAATMGLAAGGTF